MEIDDRITYEEAQKLLSDIANGEYHSIEYRTTTGYYQGETTADNQCRLYINGLNWHNGRTWYEAFHSLAQEMNKPVFTCEEQPQSVA